MDEVKLSPKTLETPSQSQLMDTCASSLHQTASYPLKRNARDASGMCPTLFILKRPDEDRPTPTKPTIKPSKQIRASQTQVSHFYPSPSLQHPLKSAPLSSFTSSRTKSYPLSHMSSKIGEWLLRFHVIVV